MIGAKYMKADMERAFIDAYYRHACRCKHIGFDIYDAHVAFAGRPDICWVMDFSSHYEIPEEMKLATTIRKMKERAEDGIRTAGSLSALWWDLGPEDTIRIEYEVWCFIPPSERLLKAVEATRESGLQVTLVTVEQVYERVRQAVLAVPVKTEEDQAFVQAASMFRRAFGV